MQRPKSGQKDIKTDIENLANSRSNSACVNLIPFQYLDCLFANTPKFVEQIQTDVADDL